MYGFWYVGSSFVESEWLVNIELIPVLEHLFAHDCIRVIFAFPGFAWFHGFEIFGGQGREVKKSIHFNDRIDAGIYALISENWNFAMAIDLLDPGIIVLGSRFELGFVSSYAILNAQDFFHPMLTL